MPCAIKIAAQHYIYILPYIMTDFNAFVRHFFRNMSIYNIDIDFVI